MGRRPLDLAGRTFGRLTVLGPSAGRVRRLRSWDCRCECGAAVTAAAQDLVSGGKRSCGCLRSDAAASASHPRARGESHHRAKLTADLVRESRALASRGVTLAEIIRRLGLNISVAALALAVKRKTWKSVE